MPDPREGLSILQRLMSVNGAPQAQTDSAIGQALFNAPELLQRLLSMNEPHPNSGKADLQKNTQGTQQRLKEMGLANTDPLADATLKELVKIRKEQVRQAADAGMPLEEIAKQSQQMSMANQPSMTLANQNINPNVIQPAVSDQPDQNIAVGGVNATNQSNALNEALAGYNYSTKPASSPFGFGGMNVDGNNVIEQKPGMIGALLSTLFTGTPYAGAIIDSNKTARLQKLTGTEPLQKGDKEKIDLETDREMAKLRATLESKGLEGLKTEESMKFGSLLEGRDAVVQIDNILQNSAQIWEQSLPSFMKSENGLLLEQAIEQAIQLKTRAETGAAMAPEELKNSKKRYAPRKNESLKNYRKRLAPLFDFYNRSIQMADPTGIHSKRSQASRYTFAKQQGMSAGDNQFTITSIKEK